MQKYSHNGRWMTLEQYQQALNPESIVEPQETDTETLTPETTETTSDEPKLDRKAIKAELKVFGIAFKNTAKTEELAELLKK